MKGLSVFLTIVLLVGANQLALYLKRAGALPAGGSQNSSGSNTVLYLGGFSKAQAPSPFATESFE